METVNGRRDKRRNKDERGFTLLELMMVTAFMVIVFASVASVIVMSQRIFYNTSAYALLTQSSMQTLRYISREISQTSPNLTPSHLNIAAGAGGNSTVCFQIPVDFDNDGDAVNGSMNPQVEWGAYSQAGQTTNGLLNDWVCYSVNNTNQLIRQVSDAAFAPAAGQTPQVVANNVQTFQAVKNSNETLTMTVTLRATNNMGQSGAGRTFNETFTSTTLLRNAVN